jgi:hypothetical protein
VVCEGGYVASYFEFQSVFFGDMRLILILIAQVFACAALAQRIEYPYHHDLKGPVRECSERKFAAHFVADKIEPGEYQEDRKIGITFFDRQGRLLEFRTHADASGKYEKVVLTYDEAGCLQEMREYREDGSFESSSVYECDAGGNVVVKTDYYFLYEGRPNGRTTYKYNEAGRLMETHWKYGRPKRNPTRPSALELQDVRHEHRYNEYDKNGFLVKWTIKREGIGGEMGDLFSGSAEIVNDAYGRPVAEYSLNDLAAKEGKTKKLSGEMAYNEQGFLSKKVTYYNLPTPPVTYYEYTYDDHGNWITLIEMKSSDRSGKDRGVPESITVREISYY